MMVDGKKPIMVVLRGPDRADIKIIKKVTGSGNIRMANPDEVKKVTQTEIGVLPAIGSLFNIPTYVDQHLLKEEQIAFGTGLRTKTIIMIPDDFARIANPIVGNFCQEKI